MVYSSSLTSADRERLGSMWSLFDRIERNPDHKTLDVGPYEVAWVQEFSKEGDNPAPSTLFASFADSRMEETRSLREISGCPYEGPCVLAYWLGSGLIAGAIGCMAVMNEDITSDYREVIERDEFSRWFNATYNAQTASGFVEVARETQGCCRTLIVWASSMNASVTTKYNGLGTIANGPNHPGLGVVVVTCIMLFLLFLTLALVTVRSAHLRSWVFPRTVSMGALDEVLAQLLEPRIGESMVSYAWNPLSKHKPIADGLASVLPFSWLDRDQLQIGEDLRQECMAAASSSRILVILMSPSYLNSANCCGELQAALRYRHRATADTIVLMQPSVCCKKMEEVETLIRNKEHAESAKQRGLPPSPLAERSPIDWPAVHAELVSAGFTVVTSLEDVLKQINIALDASQPGTAQRIITWWRRHGRPKTFPKTMPCRAPTYIPFPSSKMVQQRMPPEVTDLPKGMQWRPAISVGYVHATVDGASLFEAAILPKDVKKDVSTIHFFRLSSIVCCAFACLSFCCIFIYVPLEKVGIAFFTLVAILIILCFLLFLYPHKFTLPPRHLRSLRNYVDDSVRPLVMASFASGAAINDIVHPAARNTSLASVSMPNEEHDTFIAVSPLQAAHVGSPLTTRCGGAANLFSGFNIVCVSDATLSLDVFPSFPLSPSAGMQSSMDSSAPLPPSSSAPSIPLAALVHTLSGLVGRHGIGIPTTCVSLKDLTPWPTPLTLYVFFLDTPEGMKDWLRIVRGAKRSWPTCHVVLTLTTAATRCAFSGDDGLADMSAYLFLELSNDADTSKASGGLLPAILSAMSDR